MTVKTVKKVDTQYATSMSRIEYYLHCRFRVPVVYGEGEESGLYHDNHQISSEDFITINSKQDKESQLHALLHEAGHVILREDGEIHRARFPKVDHNRPTVGHRVDTLREEVLAWELGKSMAKDLHIEIHAEKWHNQRSRALMKYIKWASDPKEYKA
jgi:hypothetical protein